MRLAAMQPYFFPYLGYFQLIAAADRFLLYDNLNYMRQGWVHRNRIRLKGGGEFYCAAPLLGASSNVRIRDVRVDPAGRWPGRFLDLLEHNYKKAPFYDEVFPAIEQAVRRPATHLTEVNRNGICAVAEFLGIATPISHDTAPFQEFEDAARAESGPWLAALAQALWFGTIGGAGLDVFEREPPVPEALLGADNLVLLPHLGSATRETREAMGFRVLDNLMDFFDGRVPRDRVA